MVDPDLHADGAHRRGGGGEAVVDLGAQGVQRHAAFAVPLATAHLGAAQTAGALDADAERAALAGGLDGLAHRAAEGDAAFELLGDGAGDQRGIELGALDLDDFDVDLAGGDLRDLLAERVDLGALLADHDAGTGGRDDDLGLVAGALDLDLGDGGAGELLLEETTDGEVVLEGLGVILIGVPAAAPVFGDTEAEAGGHYFLAHAIMPPLGVRR